MKIAIDYTPAVAQGAGIGRYTRGLVTALADIDTTNRYVLFCAASLPKSAQWPANFTWRHSPLPARWLTIGWYRLHLPLPADLLAGQCDLYHAPDFNLPPLHRARGIVTIHDLSFLRVPECADPRLRAFLERTTPVAVARASRVLADSENTRRDLIALLGVPATKVSVVTPAVESRFRRETDEARLAAVRERYRLPERFILSLGTLEPRKNFIGLIRAYSRLRHLRTLPHALVIAGRPGWLYEAIYQAVEREHLTDAVRFLGFVADADLPALYSLADLFVYPSRYEGFGIPVLEAMACGVPVITSDNSSLPEVAGDAARLVHAEDTDMLAQAMAAVIEDTALRQGSTFHLA